MSTSTFSQLYKPEESSFFKLINSFAWEIGTLKKEMGKKNETSNGDQITDKPLWLGEEVGGLFLQASPCAGIRAGLVGARDSGYDSLHRRLSVLDRLVHTHSVWLQLGLSHQDATHILKDQPTGTFLVRKSTSLQRKVISLRMNKDSAVPIKDFPVKESQYTFSLEGSGLSFADLFRLVAFCCISRDVLPFTLKLPEAIASARTSADLEELAELGAGFWEAELYHRRKESFSLLGIAAPKKPPPPAQIPFSLPATPQRPRLRTRTPSELECYQANGALCFINPLFIKVHQTNIDQGTTTNRSETATHDPREESVSTNSQFSNKDTQHSRINSPYVCSSDPSDCSYLDWSNLKFLGRNPGLQDNYNPNNSSQKLSAAHSVSLSPPPRPPPPQHLGLPVRQRSMPEKVSWINNIPKEKREERERGSSLLSRLGSSLSITPSSSPPKRLSISSPISIPLPSFPLSLSSLSSSARREKALQSSDQDDAQCSLALEEWTIEKALIRAKLSCNDARTITQDSSSPPEQSLMTASKQTEMQEGEEEIGEECSGGDQRLSDMSISTDSSDSMDFFQSSVFFLPPLHDPSPPTEADFNTHLPLSLPPSHLPFSIMDQDDEDEDDDNNDEPDYGVSLESDQEQDQDVTMVPPGRHTKRCPSALVLQRALRGHLHKMSGVFNSLLTPEKRAIRKVVELSRRKGSYFGCLVQDYLSYMSEGATQAWQGYTSGLELLQTVRQFITQMKSYLRQSSEMEPPIESLIPEDQIDRVLEKAMHKCVLKPLKPVLCVALQEFQVSSGEWQELKENLSLAKGRHPQEMGVADALPPDPVAVEKIKHKFHTMCKLYSPEKKVTMLLRVCKLIYTIMEANSGRLYGADDFLPMLTYVLAQCDMPQLDNEILYMMELLDPSLLNGEGGYYLTSAYGAMSLIRNFQEEQAARVLSSETRDTLHQWHRRRTAQRSAPSIDDFQNYLRVALQELNSGCTAKTLQVRPYATVEEVCQLCAQKFKVSDPENYGLFLLMEGSSQQLAPDIHPQKIKAELHSRPQAPAFNFVFRRLTNSNTLTSTSNLNNLIVTCDPQANLNNPNMNQSGSPPQPGLNSGLSPALTISVQPSQLNGNSLFV
ncbi:Ras and Rab interactor 2 Ras interaction/interference protein 2 [Channa argus]|uniref:Ras and Rab interactor 2 Ras interaction/interference protein 2 n=1 Tax=Channa argus TaxID=215402 RepID=A0A6G1R274_CHAAH|nr:Ras and Rab interactor 2 Ras interaction/interference protein 2 [Channa argus]